MDTTYEACKVVHEGPISMETVTGPEQSEKRPDGLHKAKSGDWFAYHIPEPRIVAVR
jgi:hypothetical protein